MAEETEETEHKGLTEKDLKKVAVDLYENRIFSDLHLHQMGKMNDLPMVFLPVALGCFSNIPDTEIEDKIGFIYEYYDEAGPRSINGLPCFMSLKVLNKRQTEVMLAFYDDYKTMKQEFDSKD